MFPNIAAMCEKNGVTRVTGLQKSKTRINKGLQRNPESVTPKSHYESGLQKAPESVTPIYERETGLQKRGYAAGRIDKGFADFVTRVTRVTPNFNDLPRTYLQDDPVGNLVRDFMEVDGLTLEEARALAAVSVIPKPAAEWIAMISELDALIEIYCTTANLSQEDCMRIFAARHKQSLASIPDDLKWFRRATANAAHAEKGKL